jgi:hypothetical protein
MRYFEDEIKKKLKYFSSRVYNMIITTKTKNIVLLALVSTFILSIVTTQQQIFAQGLFQSQQSERNQSSLSSPPATTGENDDNSDVAKPATNDDDQKIILGNITIPINSKTQLSLEMPDSKITVEPNQ